MAVNNMTVSQFMGTEARPVAEAVIIMGTTIPKSAGADIFPNAFLPVVLVCPAGDHLFHPADLHSGDGLQEKGGVWVVGR